MRNPTPGVLLLALGACVSRSAPANGPGSQIPVLVVNESSDMMRVQAEGSATLRLAPSQRGCLHLRTTSTNLVLQATPVGAKPEGTGVGQNVLPTVQRSRAFNPLDAPAWEWRLDLNPATASTSLRPADAPCT